MGKPNLVTLDQLVRSALSRFVDLELWLSSSLEEYLATELGLVKEQLVIAVDVEESDPVSSVEDNHAFVRFNGRFYPPKEDENGSVLDLSPEKWMGKIQEWFTNEGFEVKTKVNEALIMFTVFVDCINLGGTKAEKSAETSAEPKDAAEPEKTEPETMPEKADEPAEKELDEPVDEPTEDSTEPEPTDEELDDATKALEEELSL